jgi:endonuclease-8
MPEGDTMYRSARTLDAALAGGTILRAESAAIGQAIKRLEGASIERVEARGKHLNLLFDNGLALHTHMRMSGSWHRYRPGERWRAPAWKARVVLETAEAVAVCFEAPVVELLDSRALEIHPALAALGPDLLSADFDAEQAIERLNARPDMTIAEALLDQKALAGIGNVYKNEVLFFECINPWSKVSSLDPEVLLRLVGRARTLLKANATSGAPGIRTTTGGAAVASGNRLWVYGRQGRPCLRCRTPIQSRKQGVEARTTYWCPKCQE